MTPLSALFFNPVRMSFHEPRGWHETARVHHAFLRRGGNVAAFGTRAATGETADHRVLGRGHAFGLESNGPPLLRGDCANSAGLKAEPSQSSIAGQRGHRERFAEIATEFVLLNVGVIVTAGTEAVLAAMQKTSVIPIVFGTASDPVGTGLVASLA